MQVSARRSGIVLLLVLGVLALMSLLAVSFVSLSRLERSIARGYMDHVRAQMTAESGVEAAMLALSKLEGGVMTREECERILYQYHSELPAQPLRDNRTPSLDFSNGFSNDGVSAMVSGTVSDGSYYKLRIEDESGKYNLNETPEVPAPKRVYDNIRNIVAALFDDYTFGDILAQSICLARDAQGGRFSTIEAVREAIDNAGALLADDQWEQLRGVFTLNSWLDESVIVPTYSLKGFATEYEPNPIDPDDLPHPAVFLTRGNAMEADWMTYSEKIPDRVLWDSFSPHGDGVPGDIYNFMDWQTVLFTRGEARAPVNINTCRKPLLRALIAPVRGWYLDETSHMDSWTRKGPRGIPSEWYLDLVEPFPSWTFPPLKFLYTDADTVRRVRLQREEAIWGTDGRECGRNSIFATMAVTQPLGDLLDNGSLANKIADALWERIHGFDSDGDGATDGTGDEEGNPFTQWQEFSDFVRSLVDDSESTDPIPNLTGFSYAQADALISNFNPNSNINDYNPDLIIHRLVDKPRLSRYTTEFCFEPTGTFQVESIGRVTDADAGAVAEIHATFRVFEFFRVSTQAEFMKGYDFETGTPHEEYPDPDILRFAESGGLPVRTNATITESDGILHTAGAEMDRSGKSGLFRGFSLMSYPEPITVSPNDIPIAAMTPPRWHKYYHGMSSSWQADFDYNYINDSHYDGWLGLATLQPNASEGVTNGHTPMSIVNFDKTIRPSMIADSNGADYSMMTGYDPATLIQGMEADHAPEFPAKTGTLSPIEASYNQTSAIYTNGFLVFGQDCIFIMNPTPMNFATADRLTQPLVTSPLLPRNRPIAGVLFPDGALSDAGRSLSIAASNIGSRRGKTGSVQMWIKPNFDPAYASRIRTLFSMNRYFTGESKHSWRPHSEEGFECFFIPRRGNPNANATGNRTSDLIFNNTESWGAYCSIGMIHSSWATGGLNEQPIGLLEEFKLSRSTNSSFPNAGDNLISSKYNFEGRKWNHLGLSWEYGLGKRQPCISINGQLATERDSWYGGGYTTEVSHFIDLWEDPYGGNYHNAVWGQYNCLPQWGGGGVDSPYNYLLPTPNAMKINPRYYARFGAATTETLRNYVADCTYDEIFCYPTRLKGWIGSENFVPGGNDFFTFYADGRYHAGSVAAGDAPVYTSARIDLHEALGISARDPLTPRSMSWTLYWPMKNKYQPESGNRSVNANDFEDLQSSEVNPDDRKNAWLPNEDWDPIVADVFVDNVWVFGRLDSDLYDHTEMMMTCAAGSRLPRANPHTGKSLSLRRGQEFRFRLMFNVESATVYETPVLDDVTLTFTLPSPTVLSWRIVQNAF